MRKSSSWSCMIDDIGGGVAETLRAPASRSSDAAETTATGASSKKTRKPSTRAPLPDHLPAETIVHDAPCVCPTCGGGKFGRIGADEREVLEYVPSHFKRVVHVRPKMSCRACETIVQAPMPTLPIEKGRPGSFAARPCRRVEVLRSPCATDTPTAMEVWSCVRDEGWPLGVGDQERAPNHCELLS